MNCMAFRAAHGQPQRPPLRPMWSMSELASQGPVLSPCISSLEPGRRSPSAGRSRGRDWKKSQWRRGPPHLLRAKTLGTASSGEAALSKGDPVEMLVALGSSASQGEVFKILRVELEYWKLHPRNAMPILTGLARKRFPILARHVLNLMLEARVRTDVFHYNAAISAFEKGGQWQLALSLLDSMPETRVIPDTISYNSAISACEKGGRWQLALGLMSIMPEKSVTPNEISCNAAISACSKGSQWQLALGLLGCMKSPGGNRGGLSPNEISYNAAISACEKGGQWQLAMGLLAAMPENRLVPDDFSFNSAISACAKGGHWQLALSILESMPGTSVIPNEITYNAAMSACEKGGQWQLALSLLEDMPARGLVQTKISYSAAISACEKSSQWQLALSLLGSMLGTRVAPDEINFNAAISACEKGGQWQAALSLLLEGMPGTRLMPDTISYNAAMSACQKGGQWQLALILLSRMSQMKMLPDEISYSATISACEKAGNWQLALSLLSNMCNMRVVADEICYNAALSACEKGLQWHISLDLLQQMEAAGADDTTARNAAIVTCSKAGQWQVALWLGSNLSVISGADLGSSFGTLVMECEQRNLLATERSLTDRLGEAARQGELPPGLAAVLDFSAGCRASGSGLELSQFKSLLDSLILALTSPVLTSRAQSLPRSLPYQRELALLRHVVAKAQPGCAAAAAEAVDDFGRELGGAGSWAKFAGGSKATTLLAAMSGGLPLDCPGTVRQVDERISAGVLEIGTYCGNSALRLAATLPGTRVTTLELDPVLVAIARSLVAFAGLSGVVEVWTGHSNLLIPRLAGRLVARHGLEARPCFSAIFMDRWGSQYDEDLALILKHGLLQEAGGLLVADNVLSTAAASFLWQVAATADAGSGEKPPFVSQIVSVREVADTSHEDWMSVSICSGCSSSSSSPVPKLRPLPAELVELQASSERLRERIIVPGGGEVARSEMPAFWQHAKAIFTRAGLSPLTLALGKEGRGATWQDMHNY